MSRSTQRIPKLRARGRENRRKLLREAKRLLLEENRETVKFSDVFEAAGVSRGSAYRIYIGIDDLLQDLAGEWVNNFVDYLRARSPEIQPENWAELMDFLVRCSADYWEVTSETLRVLPRIRSDAPASYRSAVRSMSLCLAEFFDHYFIVPEIPNWLPKMAFLTQLCDITFADAVRSEGRISDQRLAEAEAICRTVLALHLPAWLPARQQASQCGVTNNVHISEVHK